MADIEFQLKGLDQAIRRMKDLPMAVRKKGARFAGRRAALVVQRAAVENAKRLDDPNSKEEIWRNVAVRFSSKVFRRTGDVAFRIGVLGGARQYADTRENRRKRRVGATYKTGGSAGNPGGDTWYWRLLEFGTVHAPARPFLRRALSDNIEPATAEFAKQLSNWLDRYYRKQGIVPPDIPDSGE